MSDMEWEYGIRYDKVPSSPDMGTGMKPQTRVQWLKGLDAARICKQNKVPIGGTNHTIVYRLVGPVEVYPG